jgi:acetyl esterase/lipase
MTCFRRRLWTATVLVALLLAANLRAEERSETIRRADDVAYRPDATDDYARGRCTLDLYIPTGVEKFPTLVWFHGGGLQNGDKTSEIAVNLANRFAADGIAVVSVNYRLSPQANFPAYVEDAAAAVAWVLDHINDYGGDSEKVFVSGHSAGGYLTAMIGLDPQYLAACGHETSELAGCLPVSGQMLTHSTVRLERGLPENRPILDSDGPAFHISANAPPFLCIAGDNDLPGRAEENRYFIAALKGVGHEDAMYLEFAGRDHGSVADRTGQPDDEVARAMQAFIVERAR